MAVPASFSLSSDPFASKPATSTIFGCAAPKKGNFDHTHFTFFTAFRRNQGCTLKASMGPPGFTEKLNNNKLNTLVDAEDGEKLIYTVYGRKDIDHFENLAKVQTPKFMVIACADSRVCPSTVLGFQPGEAFMIRNIANLVPTFESGPSETNAALEFAVNSLLVENILVIGHSCCGGIRALMSMEDDDVEKSFIKSWVIGGKKARTKAKAAASNLSFDEQCTHCEKVIYIFVLRFDEQKCISLSFVLWSSLNVPTSLLSLVRSKYQESCKMLNTFKFNNALNVHLMQESINHSLLNLLTYPWIEEKVANKELSIHGGYYNFIDCSFEKWTLDYRGTKLEENGRIAAKNKIFWC
ncbi:hypothetical protein V8G54_033904 [Vigna mungo]|uniref:carbonic anhydrase n=1 Tax=Vigna mungo TaxID=3915 RepID=A0AAQ3MP52_VIGMU